MLPGVGAVRLAACPAGAWTLEDCAVGVPGDMASAWGLRVGSPPDAGVRRRLEVSRIELSRLKVKRIQDRGACASTFNRYLSSAGGGRRGWHRRMPLRMPLRMQLRGAGFGCRIMDSRVNESGGRTRSLHWQHDIGRADTPAEQRQRGDPSSEGATPSGTQGDVRPPSIIGAPLFRAAGVGLRTAPPSPKPLR